VQIAETNESRHSFSFFNFIYIGNAKSLTETERAQVIAHERVHAKQLHSFDILLLNIIGAFFWFNPVIRLYKKIFVQLHEFEADARAVRTDGVNEYCNLLARVALMSADIPMANYFNQSLTLKRIEMIRTIKRKFRKWKIAFLGAMMIGFFFLAACHDQVIDDATALAKNSSMPVDVPADVQQTYDALKAKHPDQKLLLVEVDDEGKAKLKEMQDVINSLDQNKITSINIIKPEAKAGEPVRNFMIIQHNEYVSAISERSKSDEVYTIVEESASPVGGMPALFDFLGKNMKYPTKAAQDQVEGVVMIEFVVQPDGQITDAVVKKGVEASLDAEALRVVQQLPAWNPGKNEGVVVRQKMVLPISFKLSADQKKKTSSLNNLFLPFLLQKHEDKC
jgi:TonB family protein